MSKKRQLLFLLFLVFGQSQLAFGENADVYDYLEADDGDGDDSNNHENPKDSPTFTATSSLLFTPGTGYKVFFTVNPHPENKPLQLICVLMANSNENVTIESDPISLRPGESGQISIPLPREMPGNESIWRLFAWSFTEQSAEDEYRSNAPHTLIHIQNQSSQQNAPSQSLAAVFIQTDKPAYKPDDLVRIRVITMGTDDRPHLTSGVNISITDSQRNLMKKWEQPLKLPESTSAESNVSSNKNVALFGEFQKKKSGLSSYEFQLSGEPILGNWAIQVEAGNITEKMYFDVKKYILPKFQVKIHAPSVLYGTRFISAAAKIEVTYTYGKGLQGTGNVTVSSSNDWRKKVQQFVVKDGEAIVPLTLSSSRAYSTVHNITANVTEKNTGRWQVGKATIKIFPFENCSIEWINKPSFYKPGLPLTVQLKITGRDGLPVQDVRKNALRITFPRSLNLPARETSIPPSGIVTFTFSTPLNSTTSAANSKFHVQYKKTTYDFTLPSPERGTSSGIFIDVVSPPETLNFIQGNSYNFTIRSNKPIQPESFHCLLWDDAKMDVLGAQTIINNRKENAMEFPFSLQLPKGDYTNLKVFVYFETEHNKAQHVISTSKSINTHNYLRIWVSRTLPTKTPSTVDTARTNSNATPPPSPTPTSTLAPTPSSTSTPFSSSTPTSIPSPTPTPAPSPSSTPTPTPAPSSSSTLTPTSSPTPTPAPSSSSTLTPTSSPTPTPSPGQNPDAPVATTTESTTFDYEYEDEDFPSDDPAVLEPQPEIGDKLEVEPGTAVDIHFETYPDSTIAIRGIDQSLLLLTQQDNDLDQEKVQTKRAASQSRKSHLDNIPTDNSSFLQTFRRLGISVLNSKRFTGFDALGVSATSFGSGDNLKGEEADSPPPEHTEDQDADSSRISQLDTRLRTKFPETWLWEDFQSSNDSTTTILSKTLPDTLTSWIISGFSLNPKTGLGVASPATITGFMPFFVTLNLPYSVIKYESFDLQVIVHNYLDRDVNVWVTLFNKHNNSDFSFVDERQMTRGVAKRYIKVQRNHVQVAHFVITPSVLGDIPIEVKAVTEDNTAADSILRFLKVKPEGVRQRRTQLVTFEPKDGARNLSRDGSFDVEFPRKVVKGGNSLQLTVFGDPISKMASTLDSSTSANLNHLLQIPTGCAEQTMSKFIPNILVLRYLNATNSDAKNVMQNAKKNLEKGYGNEMKYNRPDGSFGIYRDRDGQTL